MTNTLTADVEPATDPAVDIKEQYARFCRFIDRLREEQDGIMLTEHYVVLSRNMFDRLVLEANLASTLPMPMFPCMYAPLSESEISNLPSEIPPEVL